MSDYDGLAMLHYRAGRPAVPRLVLRALAGKQVVGAVVIAAPVLNGPWRALAWPGWLDGLNKPASAAEVNRRLCCIARLVVAPPFRGRGVGSALVRAYLRDPLTDRTEALAAMGSLCPVFERAGMRPVAYPISRAAAEVARRLKRKGVPVWALAYAPVRRRLAADKEVARAFASLAADRWRAGRGRPAHEQIDRLWRHIASRPAVFVVEQS